MRKLYCDSETRSSVDLAKCGADRYANDPETDWTMWSYCFDDGPVRLIVNPVLQEEIGEPEGCDWDYEFTDELPEEVADHVRSDGIVVAHNCQFDYGIWNNVCAPRHNWPLLVPSQLEDTMAKGLACAMPGNLADLGSAVGVSVPKFLDGRKVMLRYCKPNKDGEYAGDPESLGVYMNYAAFDIPPMVEIDQKLPDLSDTERQVWLLNFKINQRGIPVDLALIERIKERQAEVDQTIEEDLVALTDGDVDGAVVRSTPKLLKYLAGLGATLPNLTKGEVQKYLAGADPNSVPAQLLQLRASYCKTSLKKFDAMLDRCVDGRIRDGHVYHRATTGRFAGSGVQVQNVPRPVMGQDEIENYIEELMR